MVENFAIKKNETISCKSNKTITYSFYYTPINILLITVKNGGFM